MKQIQRFILITILFFNSNTILGQLNDSIKNAFLEKTKNDDRFKETIYDFKGKELPQFDLTLINGKRLKSDSLKGKPTLINFWFSNCTPCIEEMPVLNEIKSHFGNEINFISITYENQKEVTEFLKRTEFNFTHLVDSKNYLKSFGFFGYPKTLILDKNLMITEIEKMISKDTVNKKPNMEVFKNQIINQLTVLKNVK